MIVEKLAAAVDLMKPGGAVFACDPRRWRGAAHTGRYIGWLSHCTPNADVANAIGASIAQVSGEAEGIRVLVLTAARA